MTKTRILLADDHAVLRRGLRALIDAEPDMEVVGEVGDGDAVLSTVKRLQPDVVVMDLSMAEVGGAEATRQLKRAQAACKVLVLTVHEDRSYLREVFEAGALGYMLKRAAAEELIEAIRAIAKGTAFVDSRVAISLINVMVDEEAGPLPHEAPELTRREFDVLRHIAEGFSNKEIAARLDRQREDDRDVQGAGDGEARYPQPRRDRARGTGAGLAAGEIARRRLGVSPQACALSRSCASGIDAIVSRERRT